MLMGHGVIVAMAASGLVYVGVSLVTAPEATYRLAPFFPELAKLLAEQGRVEISGAVLPAAKDLVEIAKGNRVYLQVSVDLPVHMAWQDFIRLMSTHHDHWISLSGNDSIRRCTREDILSCVSLVRGESSSNAWLEIEGTRSMIQELKNEVAAAYHEVERVLCAEPVLVRERAA
jgi:SSS family solute:Na+ symporter